MLVIAGLAGAQIPRIINYQGRLTDAKIVNGADIAVAKISGTAVNLNSNQAIDGAKTFNNLNIASTTRRMSISYAAFNPSKNTTAYYKSDWSLRNDVLSTPSTYYATFSLPHGAVVIQLEAYFYDTDAGNFELAMRCIQETAGYSMAQVSSSGTSGFQTVADNSINFSTIDNETFMYTLRLEGATTGPSIHNLGFTGAEIEYTITKPLP